MAFEQLDLSTFELCLTCGYLRGGEPREHRCQCQPRTEEWQQQWQGRDMARDLEMCVLCVRGTVTTWSKWSWMGCDLCRHVSEVVGAWHGGRYALPLGRHSIMNGGLIRPVAETESEVREIADALLAFIGQWDSLRAWQKAEFERLAAPQRVDLPTMPLPQWQRQHPPSLGASVNAFDRYGVVPVPSDLATLRQAQETFRSAAI
ncbi:MAG TPA: hypothetical protein VFX60_16870 [Micromonospora sp.]|nr:hypothetical protein [Micromonospora sp.]